MEKINKKIAFDINRDIYKSLVKPIFGGHLGFLIIDTVK